MEKKYISEIFSRSPRPRSKRLRQQGIGGLMKGNTVVTAGASGEYHTHPNKTALDQISTDEEGYLYLTHTQEEDGNDVSVIEKVKSGYADEANHSALADLAKDLTEDSPTARLIRGILGNFIPMTKTGNTLSDTTWIDIDMGTPLFAVKSLKGFYSEEFLSARGLNPFAEDAPAGIDEAMLAQYLITNNYAKKSDIPSLADYAKKSDIPSLDSYAKKSDIPSLAGYAKTTDIQDWVLGKHYLTDHQTIYKLTFQSGTFSAKTYTPNSGTQTVNIPTTTSHITEGSRLYFTDARAQAALASTVSDLNTAIGTKLPTATFDTFKSGYDTWKATVDAFVTKFSSMFEKEADSSLPKGFRIKALFGLYSDSFLSARGMNANGGGGGNFGLMKDWPSSAPDKNGTDALGAYLGWGLKQAIADANTRIDNLPTTSVNPYALTIQKNGTTVATYDGSSAVTANITVPTNVSELTNTTLLKIDGSNGTQAGASALMRKLTEATGDVTDTTMFVTSYFTPSDTNNLFYRRSAIRLWNYIKGKTDALYQPLEDGKGLSANDFSDALLTKLNGIEAGANKYVHPTNGANTTVSAASGKVLSSITVNSLGHVTSVASKTLAISEISGLQTALDAKVAKAGDTMTGTLTISIGTASVNHLAFSRASWNYITASSAGGLLVFGTNGVAPSSTSGTLYLEGKNGRPGQNNVGTWGTSSLRWSNVYSVLGNFSGLITASGGIEIASGKKLKIGSVTIEEVDGNLYIDKGIYSDSFVSARGKNSDGSGGGGLIENVYKSTDLNKTFSDSTLTDTFNAYTIKSINDRLKTVEGKNYLDALAISTTGSGNAITAVTQSADKKTLTFTKGTTFATSSSLTSHTSNTTVHITAAERTKWNTTSTNLDTILGSNADNVINKWDEIVAFLDTYTEADTLANLLSNKVSKSGDTMTGALILTSGSAHAYDKSALSFIKTGTTTEQARIGTDTSNGLGLYATGKLYLRPNVTLGSSSTNGIVLSSTDFTYNGNDVLHMGNYATKLDERYVTLSTAQTITGTKTFNLIKVADGGYGAERPSTGIAVNGILGTMAGNDQWAIFGYGTASDSGYLEIATGDNGNEPIYVGQYNGGSPMSTASTRKHGITLMNANGNQILNDTSVNVLTIRSTSASNHIAFSREGANYFTAPSNGYFCFLPNGKTLAVANADLIVAANEVRPGTTNVVSLGTSSLRWKNVYSVLGNFSGLITASAGIKIGEATITYDSATGMLHSDKGFYSDGAVSARGANTSGGASGGGLIQTVYGSKDLGKTFTDTLTDTFNAYTINKIWNEKLNASDAANLYQPKGNYLTSHQSLANYVTLNTAQTITAQKTFTADIVMGTSHYIYGVKETSGAIAYFNGTRTVLGSIGASTTAATLLRSKTGHAEISDGTNTYNVLDTGNYTDTLDSRYVKKSGDTMTGTVTSLLTLNSSSTSLYTSIRFQKNGNYGAGIAGKDGFEYLYRINTGFTAGYKIWDEGNDGSGSGLDADLLDGLHSSSFARGGAVSYQAGNGSNNSRTAGWIRIATASNYRSYGIISVSNSYHDGATSGVTFVVNAGYTTSRCILTQIGGYSAGLFTKARIVYPSSNSGNIYIEVFYNTTSGRNTLELRLANSYAMSLLTEFTEGSIPDGYTTKELEFTNGISAPTFLGALSGNASSATKLHTSRTLWGQDFDGSANVSGDMTNVGAINASGSIKISSSAERSVRITVGDYSAGLDVSTSGNKGIWDWTASAWLIASNANNNTFLNVGNVGIGTTTPSEKLQVLGTTRTSYLIIGGTSAQSHIAFSRANWNYITAPEDGSIAFVANGKAVGGATTDLLVADGQIRPGNQNNAVELGSTSYRWKNVISVLGNFSGTISSSKVSSTYLGGSQGNAIINSTASAGSYVMLAKMNSTNGYFTHGTYLTRYELHYTAKTTVDAETNSVTHNITLLDETGLTKVKKLKIGSITLEDVGGNLHIDKGVYSDSFVSARGANSSGSSGGSAFSLMRTWDNAQKDNGNTEYALGANLGWALYNDKADKATTLAGYGITNAYTKAEVDTKLTNGSVTKVGTATVGSTTKPIYLNAGTPTASNATVGSATKPIFLSSGTVTACSYTFGNASGNAPISNGTVNTNLYAQYVSNIVARAMTADDDYDTLSNFSGAKSSGFVACNTSSLSTLDGIGTYSTLVILGHGNRVFQLQSRAFASGDNRLKWRSVKDNGASASVRYTFSDWQSIAFTDSNVASATNADMLDSRHATAFMYSENKGSTDLNTLTQSGVYRLDASNDNLPSDTYKYSQLLVLHGSGDTIAQMCFSYSTSGRIAVRSGNPKEVKPSSTNNWGAWKTLALTSDNVASATVLQTTRKIWGQDFNGAANVTGDMSNVGDITFQTGASSRKISISKNGTFKFTAGTSGWAWGLQSYASDEATLLGYAAGSYGSKDTLTYHFYGGNYDTPSMVILPNGHIGINRTDPAYYLDVSGSIRATTQLITPLVTSTAALKLNAATEVQIKYNNTDNQSVVLNSTAFKPFTAATNNINLGTSTAVWKNVYARNYTSDTTAYLSSGSATTSIIFRLGTTEKMRILQPNGYVGINMSAPTHQLDVNGTARIKDKFVVSSFDNYDSSTALDGVYAGITMNSSESVASLTMGTNGGRAMIAFSDTKKSGGASALMYSTSDTDNTLTVTGITKLVDKSTKFSLKYANATDYFTRESYAGNSWANGYGAYNTAITDNDKQTPLIVAYRAGQTPSATGENRLFSFELYNSGSHIRWYFAGKYRFQWKSEGVFYASGGMYSDGYVSARGQNTSSDARLKRNVTPFEIALHKIANAPSVCFDWNNGGRDVGSIAQYWQGVNPLLTPKGPDGYLTLQYGKTALLSVISVAKKVMSHEERIAELERENKELKHKIEILERR
ncbi:MAG: pyocin knob domain-containing S74 family peptidase [Muribaculaceae bacterium]|nr:pyocin knob domain-containing S74 family peptidase [Muribaculaceae bacterium]